MYSVVVKPIGPICNLKCEYCFYLEKEELYPDQNHFRMTDETLELFVQQYIASQPGPTVHFAWQGGEPTLLGIDFFKKVIKLQEKYLPSGWQAENAIQTNGTLLDSAWCEFFKEHRFLVGISIDGPAQFHDQYRRDKRGESTHHSVTAGVKLLQKHQVDYNVLCAVNAANVRKPKAVYQFFKDLGVQFIQFIPIIEWLDDGQTSSRSVTGSEYGRFLTAIFDEWLLNDLGRISIQLFEECFAIWSGFGGRLCVFSEVCGQALAMEHNGDVYACDHFVDGDYYLGNIHNQELGSLAQSSFIKTFGDNKREKTAKKCQTCPVLFACRGGCPKNRIDGLNYLCEGYRQFFGYIDPFMKLMVELIQMRTPIAVVQKQMQQKYDQVWANPGRNDSCPCRSGKKFKKCCLERFS